MAIPTKGSLSRRNALKAGAAVGIGVAAWSGPQIGQLGSAPAYAGVCSPGEKDCVSDQQNVSWGNCGNPQIAYIHPLTGSLTVLNNTINVSTVAGCSNGAASVTATGIPTGVTCEPSVYFFLMSNGATVGTPWVGTPGTGGTVSWTVPSLPKTNPASAFYIFSMCCSSDPGDCGLTP